MVKYDRAVIQTFADRLYAEARSITIVCGLLGLFVGGAAAVALGSTAPVLAIAAVVLATLIGIGIGRSRAFSLKLQAQTALCQVQIEENTSAQRLLIEARAKAVA